MGQGHVAGTRVMKDPQQAQGIIDRIASLHPDQTGDPARPVDAFDVVGRGRQFERLRIGGDQSLDRVDLFERLPGRLDRRQVGRHIDGPELAAYAPRPQAGNVGVQHGRRLVRVQIDGMGIIAEPLAQRPGQVIVPVDQRCGPQDLPHPRLGCGISPLRHGRAGQGRQGDGGEQGRADHGNLRKQRSPTVAQDQPAAKGARSRPLIPAKAGTQV